MCAKRILRRGWQESIQLFKECDTSLRGALVVANAGGTRTAPA